jgi:hypothetical protein
MGLGGDNFIDDELSLEHSSMSPEMFKYDDEAGRGGRLRMARGKIMMLFLNPSWNFGNSVQIHIRTAYCTYACYLAFS